MVIKKNLPETDVKIFNIPENGLSYIQNDHINYFGSTILLLDINMPDIDGWRFLEEYEKFINKTKPPIAIYLLCSSVNNRDRDRAKANKYVRGFIEKPLSCAAIIATKENWPINAD
jgi:CheY-like chemotaxis protein